ncbi:PQQ-dependent sugar dehydrogenase [Actinomadura hibisca]|uniref:PQQ-dependent sugar dehydrogenase n=1 Tax=Actinomadura hibisca TaxID=68565 RepID=UPI00082C685E|nr:PQQ-dependent sugar dehydrogenase [Actinomadura hibisca]
MRRALALATAVTLLASGACSAEPESAAPATSPPPPPSPAAKGGLGEPRVLVKGRQVTWGLAFLPGGDALMTERRSALLLRVSPSGKVTELGRVPGVAPHGEGGLLGVAVSPSYDSDKNVYVYFTAASDNRIARVRYEGGASFGRPEVLATGIPKAVNHNGGRLAFGPDGMLYASTGDAAQQGNSQDRQSLGGKILRLTPDGKPAPGNPFKTRVWTWGHRNVQGLAWDEAKRMYATEFGQDRFDEINHIVKGRNYGWPLVEGMAPSNGEFTQPLLTWATSEASPSGLAYANGSLWAAALRGRRLWQIPLNEGKVGRPVAHFQGRFGRIRSATPTPDGKAMWLTTDNGEDDGVIVVPLT